MPDSIASFLHQNQPKQRFYNDDDQTKISRRAVLHYTSMIIFKLTHIIHKAVRGINH